MTDSALCGSGSPLKYVNGFPRKSSRSKNGLALWARPFLNRHDFRGHPLTIPGVPGGEGQGDSGGEVQGRVPAPSDNKRKRASDVRGARQRCPTGQGPGWNSLQADTNGDEGYIWDSKTWTIWYPDGTTTRSTSAMAAEEERLTKGEAGLGEL